MGRAGSSELPAGALTWGFDGLESRVLDRVAAAVLATDIEGRLIYANPHARRAYAWLTEPTDGARVGDLGGVTVDARTARSIRDTLDAGGVWEGDFELHRPDGRPVWVHVADSGIHDDAGELVGVVTVISDVTDMHARADALAAETGMLRFMLDATTVLSSNLDDLECLRRLAEVAVPVLGDLCLIDVVADGTLRRVAAAAADPSVRPLVDELVERYPPAQTGRHPAPRVIETGRAEVSARMTDAFLRATTRDERHYSLVKQLGFESYMCAPLVARGRILGSCTLVSTHAERRFGNADLLAAQELAQRAALVVDNARLFSERSRVARSLQAALLPPSLPSACPFDLAARYQAAGEDIEVGGDFYDVFGVGRHGWVIAVGDVCGRGPEAAAVTALVRHSFHAAARNSSDPRVLLDTANGVLAERYGDSERFCSAAVAVIRPGSPAPVSYASAGHPPAIIARADGTIETLTASGMLLGIDERTRYHRARATLRPGDHLILYTDGLTEARDGRGRFFADHVRWVPDATAPLTSEAVATDLLDSLRHFTGDHLRDDLALLVVGNRAPAR